MQKPKLPWSIRWRYANQDWLMRLFVFLGIVAITLPPLLCVMQSETALTLMLSTLLLVLSGTFWLLQAMSVDSRMYEIYNIKHALAQWDSLSPKKQEQLLWEIKLLALNLKTCAWTRILMREGLLVPVAHIRRVEENPDTSLKLSYDRELIYLEDVSGLLVPAEGQRNTYFLIEDD